MKYIYFFAIGIALALMVIGGKTLYEKGYAKGVNSVSHTRDTVYQTLTVTQTGKPIYYRVVERRDTVIDRIVVDTVQIVIDSTKEYEGLWNSGLYLAVKDTAFENGDFKAQVTFVSPLPLHPASYFYNEFQFKKREVRVVIPEEKRFGYGVVGGYGYGFINRKPDIFIGIGFSYRVF